MRLNTTLIDFVSVPCLADGPNIVAPGDGVIPRGEVLLTGLHIPPETEPWGGGLLGERR